MLAHGVSWVVTRLRRSSRPRSRAAEHPHCRAPLASPPAAFPQRPENPGREPGGQRAIKHVPSLGEAAQPAGGLPSASPFPPFFSFPSAGRRRIIGGVMLRIGRLTISDSAFSGRTPDLSGIEIEKQLVELLGEDIKFVTRIVRHDRNRIADAIRSLVDDDRCTLVLTAGGTGPLRRDVTPEATRLVIEKELPGFGEILRMKYYETTKTAVLLRVTAGIRSHALIVNLPGTPDGLRSSLEILGPAIYECVVHIR